MVNHKHPSVIVSLSVLSLGLVCSSPIELGLYTAFEEGLEQPIYKERDVFRDKKLDLSTTSFKTENRKAQKTKETGSKTNLTVPHDVLGSSTDLYRLNTDEGGTCILIQTDALVEFKFTTTSNQVEEKDVFIPTSAIVNGDCSNEDKQNIILKWKSFVLIIYFSKTPGGERWFVSKLELKFDSSDHFFDRIKNPGRTYLLSNSNGNGQLLFPTPVGKSYVCDREIEIALSSPDTDTTAKVYLRKLKIEPFIFKNDEFGPEYRCSASGAGSYRSETAPLVVGSMLASACLITIVGYAVYRYFNIEKVQYDTME
ncbi:lysosome-associated membrane glycoprotein 5 [Cimex lectularius]|uniref:Lysosome-associated membrane glycoprotein 2-like luminal domain-containing protein n=1 Tax=Cimex lectularius TaxID=79782 RepID=A0A8I6RN76_CIMLE|nr:lysosome-associated membrane glycoprotein 5 [Cimex lectularius]